MLTLASTGSGATLPLTPFAGERRPSPRPPAPALLPLRPSSRSGLPVRFVCHVLQLFWFLLGCAITTAVAFIVHHRRRPTPVEEPPPQREIVLADNRNLETVTKGLGRDLASLASSVEGHAQLLCESIGQTSSVADQAERLWESVRRLRFFSEKMRSFARVQELSLRPTHVRPVLQALVHEIEDYHGASLQVGLDTATSLPMAMADADALRSALLFLVESVLSLAPNTPSLTIAAQTELNEDMDAEILVEIQAESDDLEDPGDQTRDIRFSYLAARNLLESQGAWVSLSHRPGLSVVASVSLKATTSTPKQVPITPVAAVPHQFGGILILDRNPGIREMLTRDLRRYGRHVIACDEGMAARSLFRATPERFELLILEEDARRLSGHELAVEALAGRPDVRVILLAPSHGGGGPLPDRPAADAAAPDPGPRCVRVSKPFGLMELRSAIGELLGPGPSPAPATGRGAGKALT